MADDTGDLSIATGIAGSIAAPGVGTMISAGLAAVGFGIKAFGTAGTVSDEKQKAGIYQQEAAASVAYSGAQTGLEISKIGYEENIEELRRQAMETDVYRKNLEEIRGAQQTAAKASAYASNQGGLFGTAAQAGQQGVTSKSAFNLEGLSISKQIGESTFDTNALISQNKIAQAQLLQGYNTQKAGFQTQLAGIQGNEATNTGLTSLGGSIMGASGPAGKLGQQFLT
jgi:hypothetical protein